MNSLKDIAKVLKKSNSVALFTHTSLDFDALGSVYALYYALKRMGKKVEIFIEEELSQKEQKIVDAKLLNHGNCDTRTFDSFVACDISSLNRLGKYAHIFDIKNNTIVIDHHLCTKFIAKYNHINTSVSSCCELVYQVIKLMKVRMDQKILSMIYVGLATDTSSFINSSTNASSFAVACEIAKGGVDIALLNQILFRSLDAKEVEFKRYLWNNCKIVKDIAYIVVDYKTLKSLGGELDTCSGFSGKLMAIEKVKYSFSLIEGTPGVYSISLRSKIGCNVRSVAEKLGGGGHLCAAGAKCQAKSITEVKNRILSTIREQQNK